MKQEFSSSVLLGGDLLTPERLTITDNVVTWKKSKIPFGSDTIEVNRSSISGVQVIKKVISSDILIHTFGNPTIMCQNLTIPNANLIKDILLNGK